MKEILYIEIPTPQLDLVRAWLQEEFDPGCGAKVHTPSGILLHFDTPATAAELETLLTNTLAIVLWSVQRTTYLKVFRWATTVLPQEQTVVQWLRQQVRDRFAPTYPEPPAIDLSHQSIFEALADQYPLTVKYFQKMPQGEADLNRVYWWERRWRDRVRMPQQADPVIQQREQSREATVREATFDLIYLGGALGVIHAAVMARLGYRVLLVERLPFGRMNREWNISRSEFQTLIDLNLFTPAEFESLIAQEYLDGFNKFFDANNPPQAKAPVLHTPTVLNIGLDAEKLLRLCGEKLREAGGEIWDATEFVRAEVTPNQAIVHCYHLPSQAARLAHGQLIVDAMGTASPIAWQLNGGRAFDSVCPTVGAVIADGFEPGVWDTRYGDVLNSHGDISRGRQLIWELFPAEGNELTVYLFHYHQVHPDNPGSLLEMYEDFFAILPEYRRCDMDKLVWKKPTFGYIPGHFSVGERDRRVAFDRLIAIGDAASLQSPLVFTGFGSLVRNLPRLTQLLHVALQHNLLKAHHLNQIRAYQSNVSVTWLFSKGMMVPTGKILPPERINAMLNTFFGILADQPPPIAEAFIKDRVDWWSFNRMAIAAAWKNPALLVWIWELAGPKDMLRWLGSYLDFTLRAFVAALVGTWFPTLVQQLQPLLERRFSALYLWLLAQSYAVTDGVGKPQPVKLPMPIREFALDTAMPLSKMK